MGERVLPWATVPPELAYFLARDACPDMEVKARALVATGHLAEGERILFGIGQLREIARQFMEAQGEGRRRGIGSAAQAGGGSSEVPPAACAAGSVSPREGGLLGSGPMQVREVAVELRVSTRQVRYLIKAKRLTATLGPGGVADRPVVGEVGEEAKGYPVSDPVTWEDIDEALGRARKTLRSETPTGGDARPATRHFLDAGFSQALASKGAELLESPVYFGFIDVATALLEQEFKDRVGKEPPPSRLARITAVARTADPDRPAKIRELKEGAARQLAAEAEAKRIAEAAAAKPSTREEVDEAWEQIDQALGLDPRARP